MSPRSIPFWSALVALLFAAVPVFAEPSPADLAKARRLFQEATALEQQSAWREASAKLDAALAIKETPGLHFHRAHCAEQLGELVTASRHYGRSEELIRSGQTAPDVEELLTAARARVLARVPRLTFEFPSDVVGQTLEIDGAKVSDPPGAPVLLDPGRHRIVARAPGRRDFEMEITLVEGQNQTLEVSLAAPREPESRAPAAVVQDSKSAADESDFGTREIVLLGEATVAIAGLAAGIGFSVARSSANDRIESAQKRVDEASTEGDRACRLSEPPAACADIPEAQADYNRAARFVTIGFVTAGVGATAALLTWALWPSDASNASAGVAPTGGGATLFVRGSF